MNIDDYNPSWQEDGLGVTGDQSNDDQDFNKDWDTNAWSRQNDGPIVGSSSGGGITVQTGPFSGGYTGTVEGVTTITLDERYFLIQDNGGGEVLISLNTTDCP